MDRSASAVWHGSLKEGKGTISTQSGTLKETQYGFSSRFADGVGTNPEELFAVGYAACFESALGTAARRRHLDAGPAAIDSTVSLLPDGSGGFRLAVTLDVTLPSVDDPDTAAKLIREADQVCPYSNATRGNVDVDLLLDGKPI